jgi:hypothetical protein
VVDGGDYTLIDSAFNQQGARLTAQGDGRRGASIEKSCGHIESGRTRWHPQSSSVFLENALESMAKSSFACN